MDWEGFFRRYREADFVPGYQIVNKLGSGVFGEVYKAKKTSIGKLYAIKFLKLQDESLGEQIVRELASIDHFAQVDHPNLVSIEDRGEVGGIPYIVMGYAGDETLKVLLRSGAIGLERAATLFSQIARGVKALHEHAIVHFDLKPANVFIKGEVARVGDYGLSRLMSESRATLSMGRGTPHYMAPEMLQRRGDARSDVYSLGVILFEMFTGRVPFEGESEWEILRRHEHESPQIPDAVPAALRGLIARALAKRPEDRYANAGALLEAFEAAVGIRAPGMTPVAPVAIPADGPAPRRKLLPGAAGGAAQLARNAGRLAAKSRLTVKRVREEVQDVLQRVRGETKDVIAAARNEFRQALHDRPPIPPAAPAALALHRRRHGPFRTLGRAIRGTFRAVWALVAFPLGIVAWLFTNLLSVIAIGAVIAGVCALVHLGLRAAIL